MKTLFIDETGDHNLSKIDKSYPIFVLSGVIVDSAYHDDILTKKLAAFKVKHFGDPNVVLHGKEMTHPQSAKSSDYVKFMDSDFRGRFYRDFEYLISGLNFDLVACVSLKTKRLAKHMPEDTDMYLLSLNKLVNMMVADLKENQHGRIIVESRSGVLDTRLAASYLTSLDNGNNMRTAKIIQKLGREITFRQKSDNIAGVQIADMLASPLARYFLGKPERPGQQISYASVLSKVRNVNGKKRDDSMHFFQK